MPISGIYISDRRVRIQVKHEGGGRTGGDSGGGGGGGGGDSGTPESPRSPPTPFHSDMDTPRTRTSNPLPSSSPFSPRYRSLSSPWGSTPSSPGGGEGTEGTRLGGSTPGGHTRLPSTDSGIQADAGWDSLTRSHKSSGKDSVASSESRTPLKTLTRCLMEPRGGWDTDPFSSPTSPTSSSDRYHSLSSAEVRQLAARGRALSCDADVRTMTSGLTNPRPLQLSGGSNVRTINIEFKGQTTPREEGGEKRVGVSRVAGDGVLCKSMDSALPTTSLRTPSSSLGGASEHYKPDGSSSHLGSRAERYRSDPLGRTDPLSSRAEHYGSRPDHLGGSFPVSRGLASRLNPSAFLTSEGYSTSSLPRRNKSREDRTPTGGPLSLLCSSTPVIPSPAGQGSPGAGGWVIGGRDHFYDRPNWLSDEGPVHAAMRIYKRDTSSAVPSSPDTESPPRFMDERHSNHAQQQQQGGYSSPEPPQQQGRSRVSSSPQGRLVPVSNTTASNTVTVASSSSSHSSLSSSGSGRAKALHVHFVDDEVSNTPPTSVSGAARARVATTSPPPSNPPPSSSSSTSRRFPRSATPPRTQDPPTSSALSPKEQESKGAGSYVASSRFTATPRSDSNNRTPRVTSKADDSQSSSSRITLRPHDSHSPSPRVTARTDDSLSPSSRMTPRTQDSQHSPSPRVTPGPDDSKDSSSQGTGASNTHSNPPTRRQRQPVEENLTVKKEEPVSNALPRPEKSPPPEQASNGQGGGTGGRARHINPVYRTKLSPVLPRGNALRAKLSLPPVTSSSSSSSNSSSSSSSSSSSNPQPVKHVDTCSACLKPPEGDVTGSDVKDDVTAASAVSSAPLPAPPEFLLKLMGKAASGQGGEGGDGRLVPVLDVRKEIPWQERRERINNSLAWLKNELASLRDMDTALVTQFQRCQDTIESLKQQHTDMAQWGDGEGSECGGDEEEAWEDWEIAEFEKKWAEAAKNKKDITLSPATNNNNDVNTNNHVTKGNDVTEGNDVSKSNNNVTPSKGPVTTHEDKTAKNTANGKKSPSPIKQDVEATL